MSRLQNIHLGEGGCVQDYIKLARELKNHLSSMGEQLADKTMRPKALHGSYGANVVFDVFLGYYPKSVSCVIWYVGRVSPKWCPHVLLTLYYHWELDFGDL